MVSNPKLVEEDVEEEEEEEEEDDGSDSDAAAGEEAVELKWSTEMRWELREKGVTAEVKEEVLVCRAGAKAIEAWSLRGRRQSRHTCDITAILTSLVSLPMEIYILIAEKK